MTVSLGEAFTPLARMERPLKRRRITSSYEGADWQLCGLTRELWMHVLHAHLRGRLAVVALVCFRPYPPTRAVFNSNEVNSAFADLVGEYIALCERDVAYGSREPRCIPCRNSVDQERYPRDFKYLADEEALEMDAAYGCDCSGEACLENSKCACWCFSQGFCYGSDGNLMKYEGIDDAVAFLFECHSLCSCTNNCALKRTGNASNSLSLSLRKFTEKGWGVVADDVISEGKLVGVYVGEYVDEEEAKKRLKRSRRASKNYLLVLQQHVCDDMALETRSSTHLSGGEDTVLRTYVDASSFGNFTRFLNHSCSPNLALVPIYRGQQSPLVAFISTRTISANEELTFAYGSVEDASNGTIPCQCNSPLCLKNLPFTPDV